MTQPDVDAVEFVFRYADSAVEGLSTWPVEDDTTGEVGFEATVEFGGPVGYGVTLLGAVVDLAEKLESEAERKEPE